MKYVSIILMSLLVISISLVAGDNDKIETDLKKVADYIINNTNYNFVDVENDRVYESLVGVEIKESFRANPFVDWKYWNGVLNLAFLQLGEVLNEKKYADFPVDNFRFIFRVLKYFENEYMKYPGNEQFPFYEHFAMSELDHCGAMGASLYEVYKSDEKEEYKAYMDKAANYIINEEIKLKDGTLARHRPRRSTVWLDDLYMSTPFLVRYSALTGDKVYLDFAIDQVIKFNNYLYDETTGLFFHCYYDQDKVNGVARWGRANGWGMMATVEVLKYTPPDHPKRGVVIELLLRQISGVSRYQTETGLWHQLLDKQDSYLETSCTAMFTYCIAKAVNEGWIHKNYISVAQQGWQGLTTTINEDGQVRGICRGTGIHSELNYYYTRPTPLNDIHGLGAVLLAGSELLRYTEKE